MTALHYCELPGEPLLAEKQKINNYMNVKSYGPGWVVEEECLREDPSRLVQVAPTHGLSIKTS